MVVRCSTCGCDLGEMDIAKGIVALISDPHTYNDMLVCGTCAKEGELLDNDTECGCNTCPGCYSDIPHTCACDTCDC
jgi:hypothetical protein